MKSFRLPKWVVAAVVAAVFVPLAVDWAQPGEGTRLAEHVLREVKVGGEGEQRMLFPFWSWLVRFAGRDVAALGSISVGAGLVCVWLVAAVFGAIFGAAVRKADAFGKNEFPFVESAAVFLAGLGFALTPGYLVAATRVSPLMVALAPVLGAVALAVRPSKWRLLLAAGLLGYSAFELVLARRVFLAMAFPAVWVWLAVGVMPALVIAWCVRKRWLLGRKALWGAFGGWALAVAVMGTVALTSGELNEGHVAARIVTAILKNAEESGKVAVVSDRGLDEMLFFMLPEGVKLISLARERDPAYGRELSDWVREVGTQMPSAYAKLDETCAATTPPPDGVGYAATAFRPVSPSTNDATLAFPDSGVATEGSVVAGSENAKVAYRASDLRSKVEDLAFAAELGPRALVDEWAKLDKAGFEAAVATVVNFFPTREKWDEARAMLGEAAVETTAGRGGTERYLRRLMAVCGNALGCRLAEEKSERDAWAIFKAIVDEVEPKNYAAHLNLLGMVQRGFAVPKDEVDDLAKRRQQIEKGLKSWEHILYAARSGGRIYVDPDDVAKYEKTKKEMAAKRELSPEIRAFIETVAVAPKDPTKGRAAQEAIHKAIREGKVRADRIGGHLITIDLALGDMENAEKDAIDVLKLNRHEPTANATLGTFAGARGDYGRAERYLRRAISTGKASIVAKNDYAYTLMRLGRLDEAEPFAREAVKGYGEAWTLHETLAAILIRKGKIEEGERELAKAEELAAKAGVPKGKVVSLEIDRARVLKAKEDFGRLKMAMRALRNRKDLTEEQREEVKGMDW